MASQQTIHSLTGELESLKAEQDKVMGLAAYIGMTREEAQQCDARRRRIYENLQSASRTNDGLINASLEMSGQAVTVPPKLFTLRQHSVLQCCHLGPVV